MRRPVITLACVALWGCDPGSGIPGSGRATVDAGATVGDGAGAEPAGPDGAGGLPRWGDVGGADGGVGGSDVGGDGPDSADGATSVADASSEGPDTGGPTDAADAAALPDADDASAPDAAADAPSGGPGDGGGADAEGADAVGADADGADAEGADTGPEDTSPPWQPAPIPAIPEEPPPPCQAALDDPSYFQFLDDVCGAKVWPSTQDRDRACPVVDTSPQMTLEDGTVVTYHPSSAPVTWDTTSLDTLVPAGMDVAVILVKRVGGVPHYRYLGHDQDTPFQPWSTTKVLAAANAAATLRVKSQYEVGLTAKAGSHQVGDLVTSMCLYDYAPYSSNALGAWFHDVGGRNKANALIHQDWLGRPAAESFGGNYGAASPPIGTTFTEPGGAQVTVPKDTTSGIPNHLSAHTLAEALKRLVLHREEETQRLPGIQWKDLRVLLFGAEASAKYGPWGGMTRDTSLYLQEAHDIGYIEERSHGQWVIFSKLGLGTKGQFTHFGYACLPVLDPTGAPVPGWGRELVIAAHLPSGGATWAERDRLLQRTYRKIVTRVVDGRL